ncbi:MAG: hypothetical protein WCX27_00960 [Candidatus Paceibacterota bacterium]|jgi:hypothetical protein
MSININIKEKAINLRREGKTYSEILKEINVAKSTLSEWLKSVGLSKTQKQVITEKRRAAQLRGAKAKKDKRIRVSSEIVSTAEKEIGRITDRELWLIGTALYWAEGAKEKEYAPGIGIGFSNSDSRMIKLFLKWLMEICKIPKNEICFEIYVHDNHKNELERFKEYWSKITGFSLDYFNTIYFKKNIIKTKRKNVGDLYFGLLRVKVLRSSTLNRKVQGWIKGIVNG